MAGRDARVALALAWAMGFVMWGLLLALSPLLPSIQEEFGLSYALRSLVLALPFLSMAAAAIPGGYLADGRGVRWTVAVGAAVAIVGAGLRGFPGSFTILPLAAALFGIGLGLVIPNLPKLVSTRFDARRIGFATGVYSTGLIAGSVVGVYGTAPLAAALGSWRIALAVWALCGIPLVAAWWFLLERDDPRIRRERRGFRDLVGRRPLWVLAFLFAAGNASYFFLVGAYPDYLVLRGMPEDEATGQLALLIGAGIPAIFLAPFLSDRVGLRRPFLWGAHAAIAVLLLVFPLVPVGTAWLTSVGLGFAEMAIFALALLLPVDLFPADEVGRATGIAVSVAYAGALLGPLAFGVIVDLTGSFGLALAAFSTLSLAAIGATCLLPESGPRKKV